MMIFKTCKDCIHYEICHLKDEKVSLGTKVEELVANEFKCFDDKANYIKINNNLNSCNSLYECPCCGGKAKIKSAKYNLLGAYGNIDTERKWWAVYCSECNLSQPIRIYDSKDKAINNWNNRISMIIDKENKARLDEKQIPNKPIGDLHSVPHYRCPVCKNSVKIYEDSRVYPYCHYCGQALDWR